MPQSMQRAACRWSFGTGHATMTCFQSWSRSATGRYGCLSRVNSRNPVILPICRLAVRPFHHGLLPRDAFLLGAAHRGQGALVVPRHDLDEPGLHGRPVAEDPLRDRALGVADVA